MARDNTIKDERAGLTIDDLPIVTMEIQLKSSLPNGKVAALLGALENVANPSGALIIHVTSAYDKEGADLIALETGYFAAVQEGKKVLVIDVNPNSKSAAIKVGLKPEISLDEYALGNQKDKAAIIHPQETSFFYAKLAAQDSSGNLLLNTRILKELLLELRGTFDLILINSDSALKSGAASILAPLTDCALIVIEAERARSPVIKELVEIIQTSGGKVAGTVMSGRRYYIPQWVYKLVLGSTNRD